MKRNRKTSLERLRVVPTFSSPPDHAKQEKDMALMLVFQNTLCAASCWRVVFSALACQLRPAKQQSRAFLRAGAQCERDLGRRRQFGKSRALVKCHFLLMSDSHGVRGLKLHQFVADADQTKLTEFLKLLGTDSVLAVCALVVLGLSPKLQQAGNSGYSSLKTPVPSHTSINNVSDSMDVLSESSISLQGGGLPELRNESVSPRSYFWPFLSPV